MDISPEQVRQLGTLARLELTDQEVNQLVEQLPKIVDYVSHLQEIDTSAVPETTRPTQRLREDRVEESSAALAILDQAPEREGKNWKVDAVFS